MHVFLTRMNCPERRMRFCTWFLGLVAALLLFSSASMVRAYSQHLVPATPLNLPAVTTGSFGIYSQYEQKYYTWVESSPATVNVNVKGGIVYTDRGNVVCTLSARQGGSWVQQDTDNSVPPNKTVYPVALDTTARGLHRLDVWGNYGGELVTWTTGTPMTAEWSATQATLYAGALNLYFYVPKGTTVVEGWAYDDYGRIKDGSGTIVFDLTTLPDTGGGSYSIPVPPGQDGKLWKFENINNYHRLYSVPPYVARNAQELLLPAEVVLADAPLVNTPLAVSGTAQMNIVTKVNPSSRVLAAANNLATHLNRITGGAFTVTTGNGATGIAVGTPEDFPALLATGIAFTPNLVTMREEYYLKSHSAGVYVLGATDLAVENAVWDLLYRLGYRQFFPGSVWEVVPSSPSLAIAVNARELPDFYDRRYFYGCGTWDGAPGTNRYAPNHPSYADWAAKNRMIGGFTLRYGHQWETIYYQNKAFIDANPAYIAEVGGVRAPRGGLKFCLSNPDVQQFLVNWALNYFVTYPTHESISMEPSDSGGWCECANCAAMGSVSDQVVTVNNLVATAVNAQYGDKIVGQNAYSFHSPPPSVSVHPKISVMAATQYITGGFSHDQLLDGWSAKGATPGVYEYLSCITWDWDKPGVAIAGNPTAVRTKIPHWFGKGARLFCGEASDNWGPCGLGYYLGARFLWDTDAAAEYAALRQDFFDRCFGPASATMEAFYALIDSATRPVLHEDLLGRMYLRLDEAYALTTDSAIRARIDALTLYARYCELYLAFSRTGAGSPEHQAAAATLIQYAYRIQYTGMVHSNGLWQGLPWIDKTVTIPAGCEWTAPTATNPWKNDTPYTAVEIQAMRTDGINNNPLLPFDPVAYSRELVPSTSLLLPSVTLGNFGYAHMSRNYYTWVNSAPGTVTVDVKGGIVYTNKGNVNTALYAMNNPDYLTPVATDGTVPPNNQWHARSYDTTFTGLHRLEVRGQWQGDNLQWATNTPMVMEMSSTESPILYGAWNAYFYVPKGTTVIGGWCMDDFGVVKDPLGITRLDLTTLPDNGGYYAIDVPPGMDGQLWKLSGVNYCHRLLTVPPYVARNSQELLLPAELVATDAYVTAPPSTTGMTVWLMADAGITKDGGNLVSAWADQSGNGNNAAQATATKKPLWVANAVNGLPALRFDGSSDTMTLPKPGTLGLAGSSHEIFIVAKTTSSTANQRLLSTGPLANYYEMWGNTSSYGFRYLPVTSPPMTGLATCGTLNQYNNGFHIYAGRVMSDTATARVDGVDGATGTLSLTDLTDQTGPYAATYLGSRVGGATFWVGDIAEVIIYNRVLSHHERLDVEAYLRNKYGL